MSVWSLPDGHRFSFHFKFAAGPLPFQLMIPAILQLLGSANGHED